MKHYIVTYEDRLWLTLAHNPREAINQVIVDFQVDGNWNDFKARSVWSCTNEKKVVEFKVVDA